MRADVISAVSDGIEGHQVKNLGFNFSGYIFTAEPPRVIDQSGKGHRWVADICGWTVALFDTHGNRRPKPLDIESLREVMWDSQINWIEYVSKILGLDKKQEEQLLCATEFDWNVVPAEEAIWTLRNLASTGEVVWRIPKSPNPYLKDEAA